MKKQNNGFTGRRLGSLSYAVRLGLLGTLSALGTTALSQTAFAQASPAAAPMQARVSRGTIAVLELRAPDGEDEVASGGTEILRAQARDAGFEVATVAQSLEQMVAAFGCDDAVPLECLQQIATHTHQNRFIFGSVRRGGPRRQTAPVRMEVRLFDNGRVSEPQNAETARAQAMDTDLWRPQIQAMVTALLPPVAVVTNNNVNNNIIVVPPPPPARPIRRYIGFGAIGLGGVSAIVGLVSGIQWLGISSAIAADATALQSGGMRSMDPGVVGLNNLVSSSNNANATGLCGDLQDPVRMGMVPAQYDPNNVSRSREDARGLCQSSAGAVLREGVFFGIGAALLGVGLVLVITDNTGNASTAPSSPSAAHSEEVARMQRRTASARPPVQWMVAPQMSFGYQGASLNMAF